MTIEDYIERTKNFLKGMQEILDKFQKQFDTQITTLLISVNERLSNAWYNYYAWQFWRDHIIFIYAQYSFDIITLKEELSLKINNLSDPKNKNISLVDLLQLLVKWNTIKKSLLSYVIKGNSLSNDIELIENNIKFLILSEKPYPKFKRSTPKLESTAPKLESTVPKIEPSSFKFETFTVPKFEIKSEPPVIPKYESNSATLKHDIKSEPETEKMDFKDDVSRETGEFGEDNQYIWDQTLHFSDNQNIAELIHNGDEIMFKSIQKISDELNMINQKIEPFKYFNLLDLIDNLSKAFMNLKENPSPELYLSLIDLNQNIIAKLETMQSDSEIQYVQKLSKINETLANMLPRPLGEDLQVLLNKIVDENQSNLKNFSSQITAEIRDPLVKSLKQSKNILDVTKELNRKLNSLDVPSTDDILKLKISLEENINKWQDITKELIHTISKDEIDLSKFTSNLKLEVDRQNKILIELNNLKDLIDNDAQTILTQRSIFSQELAQVQRDIDSKLSDVSEKIETLNSLIASATENIPELFNSVNIKKLIEIVSAENKPTTSTSTKRKPSITDTNPQKIAKY